MHLMFFFRVDWHLDTYFLQIWVVSSLSYFSWILWGSGTHNIYRLKQVIQVYQQQENYTIKFLLVTMKLPPPLHLRAHPRGFAIFFFFGGLFPIPGTQKETIPHPWVPDQPHTFFAAVFDLYKSKMTCFHSFYERYPEFIERRIMDVIM